MDTLLHQQAGTRAANMSLIEEDPTDDALDCLVDGCVLHDDMSSLATEFQRQVLTGARQLPLDGLAHPGAAGEGNLVDTLVPDQRRAGMPIAGNDIDDTLGQARLLTDFRQVERRQRRCLGRLEHHRIATCKSRCQLPCRHQQREVPGDHLTDHADRAGLRSRKSQLELVRPAAVIEKMRGGQRDVDVARLADRFATVERLQAGKLTRALQKDPSETIDVTCTLLARHRTPHLLLGPACRTHRTINILVTSMRHPCQNLLGSRVDGLEGFLAPRLDEFPVNEQAILVIDLEVVGILRCIGIGPATEGKLAPTLGCHCLF